MHAIARLAAPVPKPRVNLSASVAYLPLLATASILKSADADDGRLCRSLAVMAEPIENRKPATFLPRSETEFGGTGFVGSYLTSRAQAYRRCTGQVSYDHCGLFQLPTTARWCLAHALV